MGLRITLESNLWECFWRPLTGVGRPTWNVASTIPQAEARTPQKGESISTCVLLSLLPDLPPHASSPHIRHHDGQFLQTLSENEFFLFKLLSISISSQKQEK